MSLPSDNRPLMKAPSSEFSLQDLVEDLGRSFEFQAQSRGVQFHLFYGLKAPSVVQSEPLLIKTIFTEFLGQALKFTISDSLHLFVNIVADEQSHQTLIEASLYGTSPLQEQTPAFLQTLEILGGTLHIEESDVHTTNVLHFKIPLRKNLNENGQVLSH